MTTTKPPTQLQTCIASFATSGPPSVPVKREQEDLSVASGGVSGPEGGVSVPEFDAGSGPAKSWLAALVQEDKAKYNKFAYRLRLQSEEKRAEWGPIRAKGG